MDLTLKETPTQENRVLLTLRAWAVHLYTSLGLVTGLFALTAVIAGDAKSFFLFQGLAMFIDATDGTFARAWKVKVWAAQVDGRKLDDITDYLNYTFLPVVFAYHFGIVSGWGISVLPLVLICSVYGFCQVGAKTSDGYFTGFPNFWNFLIFYLFLFGLDPNANAIILLVFAALIFVPVKYLSYSSRPMRGTTMAMSLVYGILLLTMVESFPTPEKNLIWLSILVGPGYYIVSSVYIFLTRKPKKSPI